MTAYAPALLAEIARLREEGVSRAEIIRRTNTTEWILRRILADMPKLSAPPNKERRWQSAVAAGHDIAWRAISDAVYDGPVATSEARGGAGRGGAFGWGYRGRKELK